MLNPTKLALLHLNRDLGVERIDDPCQMDVNLPGQIDVEDRIDWTLEIVLDLLNLLMEVPRRMVFEPVAVG